jgi:hypothetical protein
MFSRTRSFSITVLLAMLLVVLAACGGSSGASASPEDRVKALFADFNSALGDANLKDAAKQDEWADKISKHFQPSEQAKQKESTKGALSTFGGAGGEMKMSIEGVTTEKVSEDGDNAVVKLTGGKVKMTLAGQTQEQDLATSGFGAGGDTVKLKKIDGVWYLTSDK